jgi:hypothetical protein
MLLSAAFLFENEDIMNKVKVLITIVSFISIIVLVPYLSLLDYPRIVRSAYYRNPSYVFNAFNEEYFTEKNFSSSRASEKLKKFGLHPTTNPKFLYLLHETDGKIDRPIIDRYFSVVTKCIIETKAESFWQITVETGLAFVEVSTGRVVYLKKDNNGDYWEPMYFS